MKEYFLPVPFCEEILAYSKKEKLTELEQIISKHNNGTLNLEEWETAILLNVAKVWRLEAELKYPFWNDEHPLYNPEHEDKFMDAQEEHWGKIAMTFPEAT